MSDASHYLRRPGDMFVAELRLSNLRVSDDGSGLERNGSAPHVARLALPTQHLTEPGFPSGQPVRWTVPLVAYFNTLIVFTAPPGSDPLPFGPAGVLGLIAQWPASGDVGALATLLLDAPGKWEFSEAPDSPPATLPWGPLIAEPPLAWPRHPLWTARPADEGTIALSGEAILHYQHVAVSGLLGVGLTGHEGKVVSPPPGEATWLVSKMTLTPLGGTVHLAGPLVASGPTPAMGYVHRTSLGRDAYARDVATGHLSSGHAATVITTNERTIRRTPITHRDGHVRSGTTAGLATDATLVIGESTVDLTAETSGADPAHRIGAFVGLHLEAGERTIDPLEEDGRRPEWLRNRGRLLSFDLIATDHSGRQLPIQMPLAFIPTGTPSDVARAFVEAGDVPKPSMATQPVTVALDPRSDGSTTFEVASVAPQPVAGTTRPVVPAFTTMSVLVNALEGLTDELPTVEFTYHPLFRSHGLDLARNPHGAILARAGAPTSAGLANAAVGGICTPVFDIGALTTEAGAVAAELVNQPVPSLADIKTAFGDATLLGGLKLSDLLADQPFPDAGNRAELPAAERRHLPDGDEVSYTLEAELRPDPPLPAVTEADSRMSLSSTIKHATDGPVQATVDGTVRGIGFSLNGVVTLRFAEVRFRSRGGATTFDVAGVAVEFGDALAFVSTLAEKLGDLGGDSGVRVEVDPGGVTAGFGLAIPDVPAGIVMFTNLTVDAWLRLPFDGGPLNFSLAVASRQRPFLATVGIFGGGGWFRLEATPDRLVALEFGIEFGGSLSLDIIVASGGVTVVAGIHVALGSGSQPLAIEAYLRASGFVSVLGLVTIFVEFRLALAFATRTEGKLTHTYFIGSASITVGIEVLFFSKSVTLPFSCEFAGATADPSFAECFEPADWEDYCGAFA